MLLDAFEGRCDSSLSVGVARRCSSVLGSVELDEYLLDSPSCGRVS